MESNSTNTSRQIVNDPKDMKVVITGATGLLGRALMKEFADCDVVGIGWSRTGNNIKKLDLRDFNKLEEFLIDEFPDVIIHSAEERNVDICEKNKEETRKFNADLTEFLARFCKENGAWLLFISTDYVFDGKNPPYKPNSPANPINEYGRSKLEGEIRARKADWGAGVLRVPVLYGPVETLSESSVTSNFKLLLDRKSVEVDDYNIRYPTFVGDVAYVCRKLAERKMKHCGFNGIFHFSGNQSFTKYQMAIKMAELTNLSPAHLKPNKSATPSDATRPHNSKLDTSILKLMGMERITSFEKAIKPVIEVHLPK